MEDESVLKYLQDVLEYVGLERKVNAAKMYAMEHPVITLFVMFLFVMCSIPIFCFFAFAFGSMILAFAGLVFIEGTLLTIAAVIMGGSLLLVGILSISFSTFIVLAAYLIHSAYNIIQRMTQRLQPTKDKAVEETKIEKN